MGNAPARAELMKLHRDVAQLADLADRGHEPVALEELVAPFGGCAIVRYARQAGAPPFPGLLVREPPEVGQVAGADLVEAGRSAGAQGSKHRDVPLHVAAGIQHTVADGRGVRPLEVDGGAVFDQLGLRQEGGDSPAPPHIGFLGLIVDHRPLHGGFDQASHYGLSQ